MTANSLFAALYWAWVISEIIVIILTITTRSGGQVQDRGSLRILWIVITASMFGGGRLAHSNFITFNGATWLGNISLALFIAGLAIRWTAIITLGRSFSVNVAIHATQTVHKTGLFRYVRHPSYSGMMLIFTALALRTGSLLGIAVVLIPISGALLYRIHVEETALRSAFGSDYDDYSKATRRLIPGVY
jgi:protein-S-isoprenylcysteine O-methyltransferase Ste14